VRKKGIFITFEGPDGSGKTSQLAALADYLRQAGYPLLATREPGGTPIGDQVRSVLMGLKNTEMQPRTEILLFQASRAQLVEQVILPHLASGYVVLCDRYADSTLAYQGYGYQKFTLEQLKPLIAFATGGLLPDLTLLLDVEVNEGLRRRMQDGDYNRLDVYECAFHERVRQGYLEMARLETERWVTVDAGQPPEQVQAAIRQIVLSRLENARL
jgi:dTMP kinase